MDEWLGGRTKVPHRILCVPPNEERERKSLLINARYKDSIITLLRSSSIEYLYKTTVYIQNYVSEFTTSKANLMHKIVHQTAFNNFEIPPYHPLLLSIVWHTR